jgi:hypothetical protein
METLSVWGPEACVGDCLPPGHFFPLGNYPLVANYIDTSGYVVFIARKQDYLAPNGIFLSCPSFVFPENVIVEPDVIRCGSVCIDRETAVVFNSGCNFSAANGNLFESRLFATVENNLGIFPKKSLFFTVFEHFEPEVLCGFDSALVNAVRAATSLMANGHILQGVDLLKGLGAGTTPAGDDFIGGLLYGLNYRQEACGEENSWLIDLIFTSSKGRNPISNAMLLHAAKGRFFASLKDFLQAVDQNSNTADSLSRLLSHGSTSGADLLSGFLFAIKHRTTVL